MIEQNGIEASLDGIVGFDIAGWAWRPAAAETPLEVEALVNGKVVATAKAVRHRNDLAGAGKRNGDCAFQIAIGRLGLRGQAASVTLRIGGVTFGSVEIDASLAAAADLYAARLPAGEEAANDPTNRGAATPTPLPMRLGGPAGLRGFIDRFDGKAVQGWCYDPKTPGKLTTLTILHAGKPIGEIHASQWREDLAELRQGDGRAGIDSPPPPRLLDGLARELDVRLGPDGPSVLEHPFVVRLDPSDQPAAAPAAKPRRKKLIPGPVEISFIVLFYNMRREAERTLTSLSRAFQRDIEDVEYEVICIDNGSKVPLEASWIESFGPEFRLLKPSQVKPSPVFALNEAAKAAKGKRLALMIDGAHVVTPGVIREALDAFKETPNAVVGLRQWFFGGDQRWFSQVGYTREMEDIVFAKIGWPNDGYKLFEVSSPMMPTPSPWFDSASESNCTILPKALFEQIGGYDEGFDIPGGGLANLDLFTRAVESPGVTAIMLLGEASFHQFHGGTTTNIDEEKKNAEVRRYKNDFSKRRGERLRHLMADRIRFRGHMPTPEATVARQRPVVRGFTGVTPQVRPTDPYLYFDDGAMEYLNGYAVESGVPEQTRWMGKPTGLAAGDLINLQEILGNVRPARIVAVNAHEGLKLYLASLLKLLDLPDTKLVLVGEGGIPGPARSDATLARVRDEVSEADSVLVIFRADADDDLPIEAVAAYARFVSRLSYMIVTGTTSGQPWLGYSTRWIRKAAQMLAASGEFRIDPSFEFHLVTACSWGYLRRTGGRQDQDDGEYDARLDDLSAL